MRSGHGTIKRSAISSPLQLISSTNNLAYSAPNLYSASSDDSDSSFHLSASSRATTPDAATPSSVEPNHLSTYFSTAQNVPARGSKDSLEHGIPQVPKRVPSHTKNSHQAAAARKRAHSVVRAQPPTSIHDIAPAQHNFSPQTDMSHPFGAELAQVNELAEGFGARDAIVMDEEEEYLTANGFCKFDADDYINDLFGGVANNPFGPFAPIWI